MGGAGKGLERLREDCVSILLGVPLALRLKVEQRLSIQECVTRVRIPQQFLPTQDTTFPAHSFFFLSYLKGQ